MFFKTISGDNNDALLDDIEDVAVLSDMNGLIHPNAAEVIDEHFTYSKREVYETKIMFTIQHKLEELLETYKPKKYTWSTRWCSTICQNETTKGTSL